ncbi:MAG TPA: membrane protein insertase YidC [Terracidiphilus sp.]
MPEIHNPNLQSQGPGGGSGGDMRSTMAFMLLVILLFFGYQYFFNKPKPETNPPVQTQVQKEPAQSAPPAASPSPRNAPASKTLQAAPNPSQPAISAASESQTTVENELFKIVLSNRGGNILHWYLKKYNDQNGKPLDMVQPQAAEKFGYPLSFFTYDDGLTKQLDQALYQVSIAGGQRAANGTLLAPASVTFRYSQNGLDAVKTIAFDSSYVISVDAKVMRDGSPVRALISWPAGLGDMDELAGSSTSLARTMTFATAAAKFAWSIDGKDDSTKAAKVSGRATLTAPYNYAAVTDLYFAAAFMPDVPETTTVVTLHDTVELASNPGQANSKTKPVDVIGMAMGSTTGEDKLRLFAGPKETEVLSSIHSMASNGQPNGPSLAPLIQFGWFTVIAKPLYLWVRWLRHVMGPGINNWGWAIVIVGILLNLLTLPSRIMMTKSSLKMMRIQPKVDALKRKYAHLKFNDPKKTEMNTEMMQLYKTEGVSMTSGCLPMLIQMPLLYAIYEVLENAIELRQAHWYWLPDLSAPDPIYVLPILIIVTMFLVQYISPSPGMDPAQRRMMAFFMPVMFGFFMLHFPSGLALYWVVGNFINLIIQIWINNSSIGKEMHAIAARRAAKKKGSLAQQRPLAKR